MYVKDDFEQIGSLKEGELVLKMPGTDFAMIYSSGASFISNDGFTGYVALELNDFVPRRVGEPEGMCGVLGEQLAEMLDLPAVHEELLHVLSLDKLYLFTSNAKDGKRVVTIPGFGDRDAFSIDDSSIDGFVVCSYSTQNGLPGFEQTGAFHSQTILGRDLSNDESSLEVNVLNLVPEVNELYAKIEKLMRRPLF